MKKVVSYVMVFILAFTFIYVYPKYEADANPAVLAASLVSPAAVLLVAAGITVAENVAIDALARWWYSEASQDVRDQLAADWAAATNGVMNISDSLWNSVRAWAQSKFLTGSQSIVVPSYVASEGTINDSLVKYSNYYIYDVATSGTLLLKAILNSGAGSITIYKEFAVPDPNLGSNVQILYISASSIGVEKTVTVDVSSGDRIFVFPSSSGTYNIDYSLTLENVSVPYTGADVLTNPAWDWQSSGKREVAVPTTLNDLVGKSYSDVIVSPTTEPTPVEVPTTEVGWLEWIYNLVSDIPNAFANSLGIDLTATEINTLPMRNLALEFTTKFPFSIPWDMRKLITVPSNQIPETFSFNFPYTNQSYSVPVPDFLPTVATWIRTGELILFALGLAFITKNLVGG